MKPGPQTRPGSEARSEHILRHLQQAGSVSVEELCKLLQVSIATVRRDLQELETHGMLRRTHGGAVSVEPLLYEPFRHDSSFREQIERHADQKRRIALAAADLIQDGETISLTAGTTTTEVVRSIRHRSGITVVTNTVNVAMELSQRRDLNVIVTGGHLRGDWFSLVGPIAEQTLQHIFTDKVFIGANGIDIERGLTCHNPDEAATNRMMVKSSRMRIAVADSSKLGLTATHRICDAGAVNLLITDTAASDEAIEPFLRQSIEVRRV
jgi:DeoR family transcriptional regulator, aga operon transcriptional repressor